MSILHSLLRWIDVNEFGNKRQERRQTEKKRAPGLDDDEDVELPPDRPSGTAKPLTCRVCGYTGGPDHRFCPRCLAETMERRR